MLNFNQTREENNIKNKHKKFFLLCKTCNHFLVGLLKYILNNSRNSVLNPPPYSRSQESPLRVCSIWVKNQWQSSSDKTMERHIHKIASLSHETPIYLLADYSSKR